MMTMRWRRLGLLYAPDGTRGWARSHAMLPTPFRLPDGNIRILIACCDEQTVGRVGYIDVDGGNPARLLAVGERPALDIGRPGCFDDNGVGPCSVVERDGAIWLYYVGYQRPGRVPYTLFTGLAVSRDFGESFTRVSEVPILDRRDGERFFRTAAFVMPHGEGWRMWYIGGDAWISTEAGEKPIYSLRYCESRDGAAWGPAREVLRPRPPKEIGFGRPYIVEDGVLKMWFSVRSLSGYSLAYAESPDGEAWSLKDGATLAGAPGGWETEMTCYPAVLRTGSATHLVYNGNGFGRTGLGIAVLEPGSQGR